MDLILKSVIINFIFLYDLNVTFGLVSGSGTVVRVLQNTQGLSKFGELLVKAHLTELFNSNGQYTIFAPNNTAFDNLPPEKRREIDSWPEGSPQLRNFVKFHALNNTLTTGKMRDSQVCTSMADKEERIFVNLRTRGPYSSNPFTGPTLFLVNGAEISDDQKDLASTNGVVHGLAQFIDITSTKTAFQYLANPDDPTIHTRKFYELTTTYLPSEYFSTLQDLLNPDTIVTVLVPSDEAMDKIPDAKLNYLRQNPSEMNRIVQAHIIPNRLLFTSYVYNDESFSSQLNRRVTFRHPYGNTTFVHSEGVDAEITRGSITVNNGVINVVDQLLGFVYNTVRETIQLDSPIFDHYVNNSEPNIRNTLAQAAGVNVFIPTDDAFNRIQSVPGVDLVSNISAVDRMVRLHILKPYQVIEISSVGGDYDSRQYRQTLYDGWDVKVYNDRNEKWVQAGYVKARIIQPDIMATNGKVHLIDSVLGIPYLDLPMLICHDSWLLKTYYYICSVGMKNFITDQRFVSKQCDIEQYAYTTGYNFNNNTFGHSNYSNGNDTNSDYGNSDIQTNFTHYDQQNTALLSGNQVAPYDMGICSGCEFTFFVPNSTAIDYFQRTPIGIKIMTESQRLQYILKRLLFKRAISLERLPNTNHVFTAMSGDSVRIMKSSNSDVKLEFSGVTAKVIRMDLGATNGMMHIIDQLLYVPDDVTRDVSPSLNSSYNVQATVEGCIDDLHMLSLLEEAIVAKGSSGTSELKSQPEELHFTCALLLTYLSTDVAQRKLAHKWQI